MERNVFIVNAHIVDSNAAFHILDGYPKLYDSKNHDNSVAKAKKRAEGEAAAAWSAMCKRDDRLLQVVTLTDAFGNNIETRTSGGFPA